VTAACMSVRSLAGKASSKSALHARWRQSLTLMSAELMVLLSHMAISIVMCSCHPKVTQQVGDTASE